MSASGEGDGDGWLSAVVDPACKVVFLDTDTMVGGAGGVPTLEIRGGCGGGGSGMSSGGHGPVHNEVEARVLAKCARVLAACGLDLRELGVSAPYRAQLVRLNELLREALGDRAAQVEAQTVDKYQGRDKDCLLVSLVRSNPEGQLGALLSDQRRVNVLLSRAKAKLVFVGSAGTLGAHEGSTMARLMALLREHGWVHPLPPGAHEESVTPTPSEESDEAYRNPPLWAWTHEAPAVQRTVQRTSGSVSASPLSQDHDQIRTGASQSLSRGLRSNFRPPSFTRPGKGKRTAVARGAGSAKTKGKLSQATLLDF